MKLITTLCFSLFFAVLSYSQHILKQKERADVINAILKERFDSLLPKLMDRTGIDMWILISHISRIQ